MIDQQIILNNMHFSYRRASFEAKSLHTRHDSRIKLDHINPSNQF